MFDKHGKGTKKVPLSRCTTPETGSGRINAPHEGRYLYAMSEGRATKKANPARVGNVIRRLFQMEIAAKMGDNLWNGKGKI